MPKRNDSDPTNLETSLGITRDLFNALWKFPLIGITVTLACCVFLFSGAPEIIAAREVLAVLAISPIVLFGLFRLLLKEKDENKIIK